MNCSIIGVALLSLEGSILMATRGTAGFEFAENMPAVSEINRFTPARRLSTLAKNQRQTGKRHYAQPDA
jgi:hypothetical protein